MMNMNERNEYMSRKLAHYNEWLLDPKRDVSDGPYPGFPEDLAAGIRVKKSSEFGKPAAEKPAKKAAAKPAAKPTAKKRAKREHGDGPTKQELACKIYQRFAGDKHATIEAIQMELGMTPAGATTYFYNARKIEGV